MNTVWLKIMVLAVLIAVGVVLYSKLVNERPKQEEPAKTLGATLREDEKRLRAEPNVPVQPEAGPNAVTAEQPRFRKLTEEEEAGASQLFELAITQRKIGRLPGMHYGPMVQYCREIIEKYPDSEYAYKAKRMLGDIPASDRERYHITPDELDLSK